MLTHHQGQSLEFTPIGIIHSPFKEKTGMPIQGVFSPEAEGRVEVFDEFAEGLADVDGFSDLYLLYAFHRAGEAQLTCVPFLDDERRGVFATRSPRRPNPLGLSIVHLLRREGRVLHVGGIDVLDGTPLLDIKPYVPKFDLRANATEGWTHDKSDKPIARNSDDRFGH